MENSVYSSVANQIFSTVALMKAAALADGDCVMTRGYYAAGDGGDGVYVVTSSSMADDGGSVIALNNGKKAELVIANDVINVLQFGAKPNDPSFDNLASINRAYAWLADNGGGTLVFPRNKVFSVKINSNLDCLNLQASNVTILGNGSTLQVRADSGDFPQFMNVDPGQNVVIDGLHFDDNILNNTGYPIPSDNLRRQMLLHFESVSNVRVVNCNFKTGGIWCINGKLSGFTLENCEFQFRTKPNISKYDVSTLYLVGEKITVTNCRFYNDNASFIPQTAMESHATQVRFTNNRSNGYQGALLIACPTTGEASAYADVEPSDILVDGNELLTGNPGNGNGCSIAIWPLSEKNIDHIKITNNIIETDKCGITNVSINSASIVSDVLIAGNQIVFTGSEKSNVPNKYAFFSTGSHGIIFRGQTQTDQITIVDNIIRNFPESAVVVSNNDGDTHPYHNVMIKNNTIVNCGFNTQYYYVSTIYLGTGVRTADVTGNLLDYHLADTPLRPILAISDNPEKIRVKDNLLAGNYHEKALDMPEPDEHYDFGLTPTNSVLLWEGVTHFNRGDIFEYNGKRYRCTSNFVLGIPSAANPSDITGTGVTVEELIAVRQLKVSDASVFRRGDVIKLGGGFVPTRQAIIGGVDYQNNILYADGYSSSWFELKAGGTAAGSPVYFVTNLASSCEEL